MTDIEEIKEDLRKTKIVLAKVIAWSTLQLGKATADGLLAELDAHVDQLGEPNE